MWKLIALQVSVMALLPLCGAEPNNEELLAAARKGDTAAVASLLEKGAAIESVTPYGQTPLYLAAMNGHVGTVRLLLEKGAKTEVKDTFYKAPMLAFVLMRKHFDVAQLLIEKGTAEPDEALTAVVTTRQANLVQALLDKTKPTQTALDRAYEMALTQKSEDVAALLAKAGAKAPTPAMAIDLKVLEGYVGTYKSEQLPLDLVVSVKEGRLFLQATGQPEFAPKPKNPTTFEFAPARLEVEFDAPGSLILRQAGATFKFKKAVAAQ